MIYCLSVLSVLYCKSFFGGYRRGIVDVFVRIDDLMCVRVPSCTCVGGCTWAGLQVPWLNVHICMYALHCTYLHITAHILHILTVLFYLYCTCAINYWNRLLLSSIVLLLDYYTATAAGVAAPTIPYYYNWY